MTGSDELERHYRRWLRWYPEAFRREYEDEMLGVLLADARDRQRRPVAMAGLDLAINGLRMRLRVASPRPERGAPVLPLIYAGAILELGAAITILLTTSSVQDNLARSNPGFNDALWRVTVAGQLEPVVLAACLAAVAWLGVGWEIHRGHDWARVAFGILLGVNLFGLYAGLAHGSAAFAPADAAIGAAVCLVQCIAAVRVFDPWFGKIGGLRTAAGRIAWPRIG